MDASHLPDIMDVGSSPFQRPEPDDPDVDLDPFRDPSVIEDEMIDYQADLVDQNDGLMQDLPDDDMIDQASTTAHDFDYNMASFVEQLPAEEDDILYEDDEENNDDVEAQPDVDQVEANVAATDDQTNPGGLDSINALQNDDELTTQDPTHDKPQDSSSAIDNLDHIQDSTDFVPPQLDEEQDAESSSGYPEQISKNSEPQEDNPAPGTGKHEPLIPQDITRDDADAHSEVVHDTNETQIQKTSNVHPVTLVYLEEEMSLFPPMLGDESTVYFLSDPSLAFEPLDKLLAACREILTGTLDHHDELVLDVPGLGLHICEDSKHSAKITLADVLEVYLNLCHNDVDGPSEPLYCHLSSRVSLASQYAYLASAGADGKTYAEIAADHIDTPLEDSTHSAGQVETRQDQNESVNTTVYQGEKVSEADSHGLPPAPSSDGQVQMNEDSIDTQHATEDTIEDADEPSQPQDRGVRALEQDASADAVSAVAHHLHYEDQEQHADISTLDDEDQEANQEESKHEQVHEIETNSSHTVEAYQDDIGNQELYDEVEGEDLFSVANPDQQGFVDQQEHAEYDENFGEEASFAEDAVGQEVSQPMSTLIPEEFNTQIFPAAVDQEPVKDDMAAVGLDDWDDEAESGVNAKQEGEVSVVPSPPITPSKAKLAKRKAEAEDDLDFLDISTPEPKRRRPS
ncbi:uncharacterized protein A1O9_07845 [Exophiala aquamarina CBS 119918]|uniref:Uncharacterized protein n=1 Tax=Exophiala aquamarina CBS 119918 TaxID=1182545 RepID=A0A072P879_9EURO|nr:uncharacterized protein A1O9_07845 [Exophiala aquamarina CBS 119918]KEF56264.1 hypothetical protein A1O9_07845 [Exophiala aquamarina CBS 119918]